MKVDSIKSNLRHEINQVTIDYEVEFDSTGKVYSSKPLLFDLPPNGQKLILGENPEELKHRIVAFQNLIPIIIPIGIHNQESFFANELSPIYRSINSSLEKNKIQLKDLDKYAEPESYEYYIHSSYSKPDIYPADFHKIWTNTMELINNRNLNINTDGLRFICYNYPQFGFKIIPLIIPFIKIANIKRIAYESLVYFVTPESLNYLKEELRTCKDGQVLSGIIKALSKHELKDLKIQQDLIKIYNSEIELSEDSKANLMEALKHYPNNESFDIGIEMLKANNRHSSGQASRTLLYMGYPAKKIAEIMLPKLMTFDPKESEAAFSILCNSDKFKKYIPNSHELLKIYVKTLEVNRNLNIIYSMPSLILNDYYNSTSNEIVNYLSNSNPNVIEGILILISCLMDEAGINTTAFYSKRAKRNYIELLNHEKEKIVQNALKILGVIGRNENNEKYIDLFLNSIQFEYKSLNSLYAMRAINHVLPAVEFNEKIIVKYLEALENSNYNYRVAALSGLRFCNDDELKRSLDYLKDDPSDKVRQESKKLLEPAERIPKSSLLTNLVRAVYMKIKYRGRTSLQRESIMEYLRSEVDKLNQKQSQKIEKYRLK